MTVEMPETYWAWVAGVIDGEGSVFVTRVRHPETRSGWYARPKLGVSNTDLPMLEQLLKSGGSVSGPTVSGQGSRRRPVYRWRAGATWLRENGERVVRYSVTKRPQLEIAIGLLGADQDAVYAARVELQRLNIGEERAAVERVSWS